VLSHVNRDNFKLNAVYDVKIDTVNTLKLLPKQIFTLLTVMSLLQAVPLAMACKQERLFTTNSDKALSASVFFVKPCRTLSINSWNTLNTIIIS
jgi:hypothetical protein